MMCPPPRLCMSGNLHSKVFGLAEQSGSAAPHETSAALNLVLREKAYGLRDIPS